MGRPLRKDVNGVDVINTYATTNTGIRLEFYDTQLRDDGVIIKQRGSKTFVVAQVGQIANASAYTTAVLQSAQPSAAGQMRILGWNGGNGGTSVAIAKLTKRIATDFSGNLYTWFLENDSSNDYIVLTAI